MNAGRKIIPIEIKKAKGTHRPHRDKITPPPSDKKPTPPSWLNKRAKQIFRHLVDHRLSDIGMASRTYTEGIALLASRQEEAERYTKILDESGYVYAAINSYGEKVVKVRPEIALRREAMRHVHSLLAEFGLTGASAQKIGKPKEKKQKNEFSVF